MIFIERELVECVLNTENSLYLARCAFVLTSQNQVVQPLRSIVSSGKGSIMGVMPAYIKEGDYEGFGLKTAKVDFRRGKQKTSHEGCILLYDSPTEGEITAVDAASVTELRTAAASAVATDILASPDSTTLAILGTGIQAREHAKIIVKIRPIEKITIWGRNEQKARAFLHWCKENLKLPVSLACTPKEAMVGADIVCTVTAAQHPFIDVTDLPNKCHINAVGASTLDFQEFFPNIYPTLDLYVDSREAVLGASSSLVEARKKKIIDSRFSMTEIGELLLSDSSIRTKNSRTMFKSIGLAAQDLVFARFIASNL